MLSRLRPIIPNAALLRFGYGLLLGLLGAGLGRLANSAPVTSVVDPEAATALSAAILFGPAGLFGAAVAGFWLGWSSHLAVTAAYLTLGACGYLGFRFVPGTGRGLPNLGSYLLLLGTGLVGALAAALLASHALFSAVWLGMALWTAGMLTATVSLAPPILLLADGCFRPALIEMRGELQSPPPRRYALNLSATLPSISRGLDITESRVRLAKDVAVHLVIVLAIAMVTLPLSLASSPSRSWMSLLFLAPVLLASFYYGVRGAAFSTSAVGVTLCLAAAISDPEGSVPELHRYAVELFPNLFILALVGATTGASRVRLAQLFERYSQLFDLSSDALLVHDAQGRILDANQRAVDLFACSRRDLEAVRLAQLVSAEDLQYLEGSEDRRRQPIETELLRPNGTVFTAEISRSQFELHGEVLQQLSLRDTSERHRLEEQLRQSQRLEAIGRLAGGVAHDFNNLLTVVTGCGELILAERPEDEGLKREVKQIIDAGNRGAALTRQLLAFSRKQILEPKVHDLNAVVSDTERMLRRLLDEGVELATHTKASPSRVRVDRVQIEQVILNLAVNARDAMPEGGRLILETDNVEVGESYAEAHPPMSAGSFVRLVVTDTGVGMNADVREHIFEPFFTSKETGKGTGLGLSTVYGIVKQSDGFIWVYSEEEIGTTFKIYLPQVEQASEEERPPVREPAVVGGSETLLLVEDAEEVRSVARRILEGAGFEVHEARDGLSALRLWEELEGKLDLLLTDVVMPSMSGPELAEQLVRLSPGLPVLYLSGYTDDAISHLGALAPGTHMLEKPFTSQSLVGKVRQVLDYERFRGAQAVTH